MNSTLIAFLCSILWGVGYTILKLLSSKISPFVVNFFYGSSLAMTNFVAIFATHGFEANGIYYLKELQSIIGLVGYIVFFSLSSFLFMYGYSQPETNTGIFTAITATYIIFTFIGSMLFAKFGWITYPDKNLYTSIPGLLLIVIGTILFTLS
jgi:drug/metabolite transporter (DMT)-like permease